MSRHCDSQRAAVFGSAFNPPQRGHADVARQAIESGRFHCLVLVPNIAHAFGKAMAPYPSRLAMLEDFVDQWLVKEREQIEIVISDVESRLFDGTAPVFTIDVLDQLRREAQTWRYEFIVGPDNADPKQWRRFRAASRIERDYGLFRARERIAVRSTDCRRWAASGDTQDHQRLHHAVGASVFARIRQQRLYGAPD